MLIVISELRQYVANSCDKSERLKKRLLYVLQNIQNLKKILNSTTVSVRLIEHTFDTKNGVWTVVTVITLP